jgi:hypothetical protein
MTDTVKPTTYEMTVFYVLPVNTGGDGSTPATDEHFQQCKYYVYDPSQKFYVSAQSAQLQSYASGDALDFVVLQQLPPTAIVYPELPPGTATLNATLFSATVMTLSAPDGGAQLPGVFLATIREEGSLPLVVIPVAKMATRGVILVFAGQDPVTGNPVLRGTSDPEIKGSTNG